MALYLGRLIGFVIYVILFVAIGLYWAITTKRVCEYASCDLKGVLIRDGMDELESPCVDFQKFTCGRQQASKVSIFDEIIHHLLKFEEMIFTEPVDYNYYHFLRPIQEFYNLCMIPGDEHDIFLAAEVILRHSIDVKKVVEKSEDTYQLEMLEFRSRNIGLKAQSLFSFYIDQDWENKHNMALYMGLPISPIFYDKMEMSFSVLNSYREYLMHPFNRMYTYPLQPDMVVELVSYHIRISRIVNSFKTKKVTYFKTTADKLQKMYPYYDWKLLISNLYPHLSLKKITIYLKYKGYFDELKDLISKKKIAALYMAYTNTIELFMYSTPIKDIKFPSEILLGISDRKQWCKNVAYTYFGPGINSFIIEKFQIKQVKQEVLAVIVDNIKKSLVTSVKNANWMPKDAKMEAIDKIRSLKARLALSQEDFNALSNPFARYNYYREVCVPNNIINALTYLNRFVLGKNLELMHRNMTIFDKSTFPEFHGVVYDSIENMVIVPTSILQFSAYDSDWPMSVNFAGIGTEISRVLISGLDFKGSRCVRNGTCNKWMNTTVENYIEKENLCLEYMRSYVDDDNATSLKMIEDLSAVKIAFDAYEIFFSKLWKDDRIIEDLSEYSSKELFFLSYGSMYCTDEPLDPNYFEVKNATPDNNSTNTTTTVNPNNITTMNLVHKTKFFKKTFGCGREDKTVNTCMIV